MDRFDTLAEQLHETAVMKGFWDPLITMDKLWGKIALIHSEATEVLEALRKTKGSYVITEELADILIRTLDLYQALKDEGFVEHSLDGVFDTKAAVNKDRAQLHGHSHG
jgi:NTP pyrophosphatase (non-canonical NTP hydrolase)